MCMKTDEIREKVRNYLQSTFLFNDNNNVISDNASFLELGIIDSTGILEVINYIQGEFKIIVNDEEILPENLDSIHNMTNFISYKLEK